MTVSKREITLKLDGNRPLKQAVEEYQTYGKVMKLSPMTLKHRENCLALYLGVVGEDTLCKDITSSSIECHLFNLN